MPLRSAGTPCRRRAAHDAGHERHLSWMDRGRSLGTAILCPRLKYCRLGGVSEIAEEVALSDYARLCGRTLARAHARSGEPAVIAGYMGKSDAFDDALASFALAYTDQTITDHAALVKAKSETPTKKTKSRSANDFRPIQR